MIEAICPRCGRKHLADEVHMGRQLRCAGCGDPVFIGTSQRQDQTLDVPIEFVIGPKKSKRASFFRSFISARTVTFSLMVLFITITSFLVGRRSVSQLNPENRQPAAEVAGGNAASATSANSIENETGSPVTRDRAARHPDGQAGDIFDQVAKETAAQVAVPPKPTGSPQKVRSLKPREFDWDDSSRTKASDGSSDLLSSTAGCVGIACGQPIAESPRHASGDQLTGTSSDFTGRGILRLKCFSNADSVVLVLDQSRSEVLRSTYLRANDTLEIKGIRPGSYWVRVTQGHQWNDAEGRFKSGPRYFEFPHAYQFEEQKTSAGIEFTRLTLTLSDVINGNVRAVDISGESFWPNGVVHHVTQ